MTGLVDFIIINVEVLSLFNCNTKTPRGGISGGFLFVVFDRNTLGLVAHKGNNGV